MAALGWAAQQQGLELCSTSMMNEFNSIDTLISTALSRNWCVDPACATCGSFEFCNALKKISRDKIIEDLRKLNHEFFIMNNDVFRLIIRECSLLPLGGDLLSSLSGTPAGEQLQKNIDYSNNEYEKRQRYEKFRAIYESKEAIEERKIKRKELREIATQPHREKKKLNAEEIKNIILIFEKIPSAELLKTAINLETKISMRAIGGLVYKRLLNNFQSSSISLNDKKILIELSKTHNGHWKKLVCKLSINQTN